MRNQQTNDKMNREMINDSNENSIRECYVRIKRLHTKDLPELYESVSTIDSNKCNLYVDPGPRIDENHGNIQTIVPNAKTHNVKIHGKVNNFF